MQIIWFALDTLDLDPLINLVNFVVVIKFSFDKNIISVC